MEKTLKSFDISKKTGFLPEVAPLDTLPSDSIYGKWNEIFRQLSDLLQKRELRAKVDNLDLPEFGVQNLHTEEQLRAALVLLSGVFQGYMWQNGEKGLPTKMPAIISRPFFEVSKKIGTPLVGTYASMVLYNWRLKDPSGDIKVENLEAIVNHTGTADESGFFMVHVDIEVKAVPAIKAIWDGLTAMEKRDSVMLKQCLADIESALKEMMSVLKRMKYYCEPKTFYCDIRPYLRGTDAFPNGMVYEGVHPETKQYKGASAAQSTPLKAIDCFLGVEHSEKDSSDLLDDMRSYMPKKHREFIEYLSEQASVKKYIIDNSIKDPKLIKQFNATIEALVLFRNEHIQTVTLYVVIPQTEHTTDPSLKDRGTGGTPFMKFLKKVRDDTKEAIIL